MDKRRITIPFVAGLLLLSTFSATAQAATVRTFESETVGVPPTGARTQGDVKVEDVTVGSVRTRATHLVDNSSTVHTKAIFLNGSLPATHFEFDFLSRTTTEPSLVTVHGNGAPEATGAYRFSFAPEVAGSTTAIVTVYNGTSWDRLARVPGLLNPNAWQRVKIDASPATIVLTLNNDRYKTYVQAAKPTQITSLEFASEGTVPTGQNTYIDNLLIEAMSAGDERLNGLIPAVDPLRIVRGQPQRDQPVATFKAPGDLTGSQFKADVLADTAWAAGRVTGPDSAGVFTVRGSFTFDAHGSRPLSVRLTTPFNITTVTTAWVLVDQYSLVATDPVGTEIRFPDIIKLRDGRLMAVYHSAAAHTAANGNIKMVFSSNLGMNWTPAVTVVDNAYDNRDPKLVQLSDGTILLSFFQTEWAGQAQTNLGTFVSRWEPGQPGFGPPVKVASNVAGSWSHAPAVELSPGHVVLPLYGYGARLAHSRDGGRTFLPAEEIFVVRDTAARAYVEPNLTKLATGELIMLIRTADKATSKPVNSALARSSGDGTDWSSTIETSSYPTTSHHQLLTSDQRVLLTYGQLINGDRPTFGAMITNPKGAWSGYKSVLLYDAGNADQANPSSAEIEPGRYITLAFNVGARALIARYTNDATYR